MRYLLVILILIGVSCSKDAEIGCEPYKVKYADIVYNVFYDGKLTVEISNYTDSVFIFEVERVELDGGYRLDYYPLDTLTGESFFEREFYSGQKYSIQTQDTTGLKIAFLGYCN